MSLLLYGIAAGGLVTVAAFEAVEERWWTATAMVLVAAVTLAVAVVA